MAASKRGNPLVPPRAAIDTTGMDPEMISTLSSSSTIGKQATPVAKISKGIDPMAQWNRVDKARAIKGKPSLPKPGTKAYTR